MIKKLTPEQLLAHKELIEDLGGPAAVRRLIERRLEVTVVVSAVSNWMVRGIPADYRPCLTVAAMEKHLPVPHRFLDTGKLPPPPTEEVPFL